MYSRNDDFTYDSQGRMEPTYENLLHIFCTDLELGHIRFDTRAGRAIDVSLWYSANRNRRLCLI